MNKGLCLNEKRALFLQTCKNRVEDNQKWDTFTVNGILKEVKGGKCLILGWTEDEKGWRSGTEYLEHETGRFIHGFDSDYKTVDEQKAKRIIDGYIEDVKNDAWINEERGKWEITGRLKGYSESERCEIGPRSDTWQVFTLCALLQESTGILHTVVEEKK